MDVDGGLLRGALMETDRRWLLVSLGGVRLDAGWLRLVLLHGRLSMVVSGCSKAGSGVLLW